MLAIGARHAQLHPRHGPRFDDVPHLALATGKQSAPGLDLEKDDAPQRTV